MASLIDLNLYPDPPNTATIATGYATTAATLITPKIEPKLEPLDQPLDVPPQPYLASIPIPNPNPNPTFTLIPQHPTLVPDSNLFGAHPEVDQNNVYSEFHRISELFRTAFAKNMDKYDDIQASDPDSQAIVSVPAENQLSPVVVSSRRKYPARSSELVRVTNLGIQDERYFRDVVRKTRMIYDSLRVLVVMEDDKRRSFGIARCPRARGDLKAASVMKDRGLWLNRDKRIVGAIPGVHIGDVFFFRMELCVVGMHGQAQAGIDYLTSSQSSNGEPIATSVIVSGGYEDDEDAGDVIVYTGHGGQDKNSRQVVHQKLEGGNLAMERSMHYGIEVRVIRGFRYEGSASGKVYVYDGLYKIVEAWFDVGKSGFGVFKFKLVRMENQSEMGSATLKFAENLRTRPLEVRPVGYVSFDISMNKEKAPVFLFNDIDGNHEPMYYDYLVTTVSPPFVYHLGGKAGGCNCVSGCSHDCFCAKKNGGEFAYDSNGLLVRGKPLIFECGPHCRCPPSCQNRVSQNGLRNRFEVFRSRETGWGVRSLDLIQAGSFICEYTGVVLTREQAQLFTMNGDSLVYPNRFGERWAEWGDLSQIFSDYVRPSYPSVPPLDFAMDVSRMRNLACYMSHSSCPNVLVQLVLYDHSNFAFPHLMLFAMENIPPLRELSLDYGASDEWMGKLSICN
ncbi:histone-lysine N-methyltransferase family member SUVH9-like isoform X1 [Cynara cardunculus var. scolymus]|uniref:Histone H3-K9 methyltransferase, plant n=1 Tax=Cynara cardunculus var. scolymus TaxID=59895 RepID=A0A103XHS9_CYNCS|nr:histone-lysine N-methyltransferase family member SUVH9-like isoform X1 [Cynara cardunculus var. scolymus]XP_024985493.1 histone-lysine N-methyltransferase family member SUVH9-like isoform X1 [Cynara cardunculus var. scolymus]XP_024985494.1 histone-lysine N-methyltransferase family member SUVH9-like isoform X1 [Cynara cardunculus var. scolymus]KVH91011.1 histone H3-K9 methyltransferase, plant [Cynara cardunculus var. scolymus]